MWVTRVLLCASKSEVGTIVGMMASPGSASRRSRLSASFRRVLVQQGLEAGMVAEGVPEGVNLKDWDKESGGQMPETGYPFGLSSS